MHLLAVPENIFFLVLVAVIGLIRWIMAATEKAKNSDAQKRGGGQTPNAPVERAPAQTEEERVRRFMEALGVPTSNASPAPPRRTVTPKTPPRTKRRIPPIDPFPRPGTGKWLSESPVVVTTPAPVAPPPIPESTSPSLPKPSIVSPVFEVRVVDGSADESRTSAQPLVRPIIPRESWAARLASAGGLRDAVVLREIFGPPRSLQPVDLHSLG